MTTAELYAFKLDGEHIDIVSNFNVLGSVICDHADCRKEIRRRAMDRMTYILVFHYLDRYLQLQRENWFILLCFLW